MTFSIKCLYAKLNISDTQHSNVMYCYAEYGIFYIIMLSVILNVVALSVAMLNVVMLSVVTPLKLIKKILSALKS
jgi:hypothetical protein